MTAPAIVVACRAMVAQSRETYRREVRAKARYYKRSRDLVHALGWYVATPRDVSPIEATQRIIRALGHRLHYHVSAGNLIANRRAPSTRMALFGECYHLWHLQAEREAVE